MPTSTAFGGLPLDAAGNLALGVPTPSTAPVSGTLTTITTDKVTLPISGGQWATAKFTVTTAGTATATAQVSIDGGINYIAAPYAKRLSTVSLNPTVQAITATTLVTGDVWEVPLPANATHFQLLCGGTGTVTTVTLSGGVLYVPGMPVVAVLYEVTSAVNTVNNTGILDVSGWASLGIYALTPAGGSGNGFTGDDAGADIVGVWTAGAAYNAYSGWGPGAAGAQAISAQLTRRVRFTLAPVAALTSRLRIEARR